MRFPAAGLAIVLLAAGAAPAQGQTFPYEAAVASENAAIHSGPGGRYYVTGRVSRGTSVTVHRHDPGGWYMIAPPPGSFSWIRAEHVRRIDSSRGELTANSVVVRVGSSLDDSHHVEQVRLSTGDVVEILGEATLNARPGPTRMFKIKPPRGEFRWIQGRDVVPADATLREQHDRNPFAVPSTARRSVAAAGDGSSSNADRSTGGANSEKNAAEELPGFDRPIARSNTGPAARRSGPSDDQVAADRGRLEHLDAQFRSVIQREIATWDFSGLEREYRRLQAEASLPALAGQVQLRLDALERYHQRKQEHDNVTRLISETSRRDAELLAIQTRQHELGGTTQLPPAPEHAAGQAGVAAAGPWRPRISQPAVSGTGSLVQPGRPGAAVPPGANPGISRRPHSAASPGPPQPHPSAPVSPQGPRFDGAGVLQRAATTYRGAPRYVLLAPNGRVLSYLEPAPGLNLEPYVGQSLGVSGPRQHRRDLQADLIVVRGLTPVRLVPAP